jgi:GTPase
VRQVLLRTIQALLVPYMPPVVTPIADPCNGAVDFGCNCGKSVYLWPAMQRTGQVPLVGRTNVGKSTFLNAALGEPLAIVSRHPQTTRDALLGVVMWKEAEIALVDCPGFHKPRNELGVRMNVIAKDQLIHADLVLLVTDIEPLLRISRGRARSAPVDLRRQYDDELKLMSDIPETIPYAVIVNKVDKLSDKGLLLPLLSQLHEVRPSVSIIPTSCLLRDDVERVLDVIAPLLPVGPHRYGADTLTDRPNRYFVAEYIREQVMQGTSGEVPFAVAVTVDEFSELPSITIIKATLSVEKEGQRIILIGRGAQKIRDIGIRSRKRIEELLRKKVHLELFVRTRNYWRNNQVELEDLGYGNPTRQLTRNADRGRL